MELLIVTTHYPYGTWQESFFSTELEVAARYFKKVTVLPIKELKGRRNLPFGVKLLEPLVGISRWRFFLRWIICMRTWKFFLNALKDAYKQNKLKLISIPTCMKFACYRSAISRNLYLREFVKKPADRVVYSYWAHIPAIAALEASDQGVATCVRYHGGDLYEEQWPSAGHVIPWRSELREKVKLHLFVSQHGKEYFERLDRETSKKTLVVRRLGCPDFGPPRSRLGNDPDSLTIVSVSSIVPNKRVHLIFALAKALGQRRRVVWHHFGQGEQSDFDGITGGCSTGIEVVWHGDTANADIQRFYRENDVSFFVNMSLSEGVPVSIMEAINADIPVIATNVGGTPEVVLNGRSGFTVSCDDCLDPDRLADRVLREIAPGGLIARSRPRAVWQECWDAHKNALLLCESLRAIAADR